jgi:hypothetical protein
MGKRKDTSTEDELIVGMYQCGKVFYIYVNNIRNGVSSVKHCYVGIRTVEQHVS